MPKLPLIEAGYPVFLGDGAGAFGAVREVAPRGEPVLVVNVEGGGDTIIPLDAVAKVTAKRVVVRWDRLPDAVGEAIRHARDREDFPPPGEEVELIPASTESEDEDGRNIYDGPRVQSPASELPGRDVGSRYGAPPSITGKRTSGRSKSRPS
jgi:hypothetical protein